MKKQRVAPIPIPTFEALKETADSGSLPTAETVETVVSTLTGKKQLETKKKTEKTIIKEVKKIGRPLKTNAAGRSVYNTMVQKALIRDIRRISVDEDATVADLIEEALIMLINDRKKNRKIVTDSLLNS